MLSEIYSGSYYDGPKYLGYENPEYVVDYDLTLYHLEEHDDEDARYIFGLMFSKVIPTLYDNGENGKVDDIVKAILRRKKEEAMSMLLNELKELAPQIIEEDEDIEKLVEEWGETYFEKKAEEQW